MKNRFLKFIKPNLDLSIALPLLLQLFIDKLFASNITTFWGWAHAQTILGWGRGVDKILVFFEIAKKFSRAFILEKMLFFLAMIEKNREIYDNKISCALKKTQLT